MSLSDTELVQFAESIIKDVDVKHNLEQQEGKTQVSRAVDAALAAEAPCVFRNWLAYQAKRSASRSVWQARGEKSLYEWVNVILAQIEEKAGQGQGGDREIMKTLARFLGFLRRAMVAELGEKEEVGA
ncbi:MAG TPA: hypothetical protein GX513_03885 [Firmicutes bacterium]|nr:hypothetical protein [Bacillota bacterium]